MIKIKLDATITMVEKSEARDLSCTKCSRKIKYRFQLKEHNLCVSCCKKEEVNLRNYHEKLILG